MNLERIAKFLFDTLRDERPPGASSIGAITVESATKIVFPVSDGENIYKITIERI